MISICKHFDSMRAINVRVSSVPPTCEHFCYFRIKNVIADVTASCRPVESIRALSRVPSTYGHRAAAPGRHILLSRMSYACQHFAAIVLPLCYLGPYSLSFCRSTAYVINIGCRTTKAWRIRALGRGKAQPQRDAARAQTAQRSATQRGAYVHCPLRMTGYIPSKTINDTTSAAHMLLMSLVQDYAGAQF